MERTPRGRRSDLERPLRRDSELQLTKHPRPGANRVHASRQARPARFPLALRIARQNKSPPGRQLSTCDASALTGLPLFH